MLDAMYSLLGQRNDQESITEKQVTVITFGTWDLFHIAHLNILLNAGNLGTNLIVGVSSDEFSYRKKARYPIFNQWERMCIVSGIKGVKEVFLEESMEQKREYILRYKADILVMGDDWAGKFDYLNDICKVIYLPRTKGISTTEIIETIRRPAVP